MPFVLRYDAEKVPPILRTYLASDGWDEYDEEKGEDEQPPYNLWWKSARFTVSQLEGAKYPYQRLNHFPKSGEITKKDTLLRNLRRMRVVHGQVCEILPVSFILPGEYVKFCQHFAAVRERARTPPTWICKPSELSRGRKIYVFRDIGDLSYDCPSVVQTYIDRPLLLSGYKFDLRLYVLVTSFSPLRVYVYRNFLVRFGTEKYDLRDLKNLHSHLTNTSLNKNAPNCTAEKEGIGEGCKWDADRFTEWLRHTGVPMDVLWTRIETVVNITLLSISTSVPRHEACFELYGFDMIIDQSLKPWLLEVNFSPALQVDGEVDEKVKGPLVRDMMQTLKVQEHPASPAPSPSATCRKKSTCTRHRAVREVQACRKSSLPFHDSAEGDFDLCFPFNKETETAATTLAVCPQGDRDACIRFIIAEIKKKELPALQKCKVLCKALWNTPTPAPTPPPQPRPPEKEPDLQEIQQKAIRLLASGPPSRSLAKTSKERSLTTRTPKRKSGERCSYLLAR
eukprot:TRINITY_DN2228_c2_g2_i1.p1 TRINITY_DN2228_c2_g2~~TRINITY_DN2228_c2_g2_i1.p1  ORF type:complete len:509 (+),score=49.48 TRINITY_DN2228_c2_g2_i1:35-1561(+)